MQQHRFTDAFGSLCRCKSRVQNKGLNMVARNGIEPPTPAFSGLRQFLRGAAPLTNASRNTGAQHRSPRAQQILQLGKLWWPGTESNRRRQPFQGCALPTELPGHFGWVTYVHLRWDRLKTLCVRNVFDYNNLAEFTQTVAKTIQ